MSVQMSGLVSGLPVDDLIRVSLLQYQNRIYSYEDKKDALESQKTTLDSIQGYYSKLSNTLQNFTDAKISDNMSLFKKKKVENSDSSKLSVLVNNTAEPQDFNVRINTLATESKIAVGIPATTVSGLVTGSSAFEDVDTKNVTDGDIRLKHNGVNHKISVDDLDTVDSFIASLEALDSGISVSVTNGAITISSTDPNFSFGSVFDTSNIVSELGFTQNPDGSYTSEVLNATNTSFNYEEPLFGNAANLTTEVTTGSFWIGDAEITIDEDTSLSDIVWEINSNPDTGVSAKYDSKSKELILTSDTGGSTPIFIDGGSTNFTDVFGLTVNGDADLSVQTLGLNAEIEINGEVITPRSNVVDLSDYGYDGVTLNLKRAMDADDDDIEVSVSNDTDPIKDSLKSFVENINSIINSIDRNTAEAGNLKGDFTLTMMRNDVRTSAMEAVEGLSKYNTLASIGITTGAIGSSADDLSNNLEFDASVFEEAYAKSPSQVEALLIGNKSMGITGIMETFESKIEAILDYENGFFETKEESLDTQIKDLDKSITRQSEQMAARRKTLEAQYAALETTLNQMQSQSASLNF